MKKTALLSEILISIANTRAAIMLGLFSTKPKAAGVKWVLFLISDTQSYYYSNSYFFSFLSILVRMHEVNECGT